MFENFNRMVEENKKFRAKMKKSEQKQEQKQTKPISFWREDDKRTTSSGVML